MIRVALKGLAGRKLRTLLTALAIVLGVAMVSGTYVLTDTIQKAFDAIFTESYRGTSAVVTGRTAFSAGEQNGEIGAVSFPETLLARVRTRPTVDAAIGGVADETQLLGRDGEVITSGGAPNLGFSVDPTQPRFNALTLTSGGWPRAGEVAIDEATADEQDYAVGDTIGVFAAGPVERMRISGIVRFGAVSSIGGATLAAFDLPTAQKLFGKEGQLDQIRIAAREDVSPAELVADVRKVLPPTAQVRTGSSQARTEAQGTSEFIGFLQKFLLAFGGIALFVGSFVIANTLSITIAQRTREFATIRTLGGSRRQILWSVVLEALVIGVLASLVGLFLGLALAKGLNAVFVHFGIDLPNTGLVFATRTIVVSLLVGIGVTVLASLRPALRATRVAPISAVREGATLPPGRLARLRPVGALLLAGGGLAALLFGLFRDGLGTELVLLAMGGGALLVFFGVALFAAKLVRPLAGTLGWPSSRFGGVAGRLARDNARRNPARTASTAAALMIGLALVTLVAVLGQGIRSTFTDSVEALFVADYALTAQNNFGSLPVAVGEAAAKSPGVEAAAGVRSGEARVAGKTEWITAVDPDIAQLIDVEWAEGSAAVPAQLGRDGVFLDEDYATKRRLSIGSPLKLLTPTGRRLQLKVEGVFDPPPGGSPFGAITMSSTLFDASYPQPKNQMTFLNTRGGVSEENTRALEAALKPFPNAKVQTRQDFIDAQAEALGQILNILYVLLALSVVVSLFGIVNTLVLTVFERTRELGMLRAVGMTRRQVRRMIRHESVVTALIGAALGIALGVLFGALLIARVDFIEFAFPVFSVVLFTLAAIAAGIVAAILPARRAARLNVLDALQYE